MTAEEAISKYTKAYHGNVQGKYTLQFKVANGFIRMAHVSDDGFVQWHMRSLTPDQLFKMAKMLDLGLESGDSRKPTPYINKKGSKNGTVQV